MLDVSILRELLGPQGQAALTEAQAYRPTDQTFLACYQQLQKRFPSTLAKAATEMAMLRRKAQAKFPHWSAFLYTTREALEQSSREAVALYRAHRYAAYACVTDLTCGMGADTLALALTGRQVQAVDRDPLRVALTIANIAAFHLLPRVNVCEGDCMAWQIGSSTAVWVDPARRLGQQRWLHPEKYQPPLSALAAYLKPNRPWGVKLAPGVHWEALQPYFGTAEAEFIAADGELRECVLWFGPLSTCERRATVVLSDPRPCSSRLPSTEPSQAKAMAYCPAAVSLTWSGPLPTPRMGRLAKFVYLPSPAVVRAGLLDVLGLQLDAVRIDHQTTLLTSDQLRHTALATIFRVCERLPANPKKVGQVLACRHFKQLTVIQCGSSLDATKWQQIASRSLRCNPNPSAEGTSAFLLLTRDLQRSCVLIAEGISAPEPQYL